MPCAEQVGEQPRGRRADAGAAGGQRREPQQHERAGDLALDLGAAAGRVRADQRALQLGALLGGDVPGREGAEPRRDAVRRGRARRRARSTAARAASMAATASSVSRPAGAVAGDRDDVGDRQRSGADRTGADDGDTGVRWWLMPRLHSSAASGARGDGRFVSRIRDNGDTGCRDHVPAATRTLRVLRFLAAQPAPVSLERIATACELPRSTAYHLLGAMVGRGLRGPPARGAPLRARRGRVRGRQRLHPPGAARAARPPAARPARRRGRRRAPTWWSCTDVTCSTSSRSGRRAGRRW